MPDEFFLFKGHFEQHILSVSYFVVFLVEFRAEPDSCQPPGACCLSGGETSEVFTWEEVALCGNPIANGVGGANCTEGKTVTRKDREKT